MTCVERTEHATSIINRESIVFAAHYIILTLLCYFEMTRDDQRAANLFMQLQKTILDQLVVPELWRNKSNCPHVRSNKLDESHQDDIFLSF